MAPDRTRPDTPPRSPRVVFPDADAEANRLLDGPLTKRLHALGTFDSYQSPPADDSEFALRTVAAEGILLGWRLPRQALDAAESLRVISFLGSSPATFVDLEACAERGIVVTACRHYGDNAVAEHTMALVWSLLRRIPHHDAAIRAGHWDQGPAVQELAGLTLGIIGLGGIGRRVAEIAHALGMRVIYWNRTTRSEPDRPPGAVPASISDILETSDVVSVHLSASEETRGFLGRDELQRMKPSAVLVNTGRGMLLDEAALAHALTTGNIAGAALDVFVDEPLPNSSPLRAAPNTIFTPHVAFNTQQATIALFDAAVSNLENFFAGHPTNVVPPTRARNTDGGQS